MWLGGQVVWWWGVPEYRECFGAGLAVDAEERVVDETGSDALLVDMQLGYANVIW